MEIQIIIDLKTSASKFATDQNTFEITSTNTYLYFLNMFIIKRLRGDRGNSQERQRESGLSLEIRDADAISANLATKLSDLQSAGDQSDKAHSENLSDLNRADWSESMESICLRNHRARKDGELTLLKENLPGKF